MTKTIEHLTELERAIDDLTTRAHGLIERLRKTSHQAKRDAELIGLILGQNDVDLVDRRPDGIEVELGRRIAW
jgi:hypothetical protein